MSFPVCFAADIHTGHPSNRAIREGIDSTAAVQLSQQRLHAGILGFRGASFVTYGPKRSSSP
jgi:hypothetical protein